MEPRSSPSGKQITLGDLPPEIANHLFYPYLSDASISALACTSTFFNPYYEDGRKGELIRLGFSRRVLQNLEQLRDDEKVSFSYKQVFLKFKRLMEHPDDPDAKFCIQDEANNFFCLLSAATMLHFGIDSITK